MFTLLKFSLVRRVFFFAILFIVNVSYVIASDSIRLDCIEAINEDIVNSPGVQLNCSPVQVEIGSNEIQNPQQESVEKEIKENKEEKNIIGEEPPEDISRLFLRESEVLLKPRELQLSMGFNYEKNDRQQNLRLTRNRNISIPLSISAGLTDNLEAFASVPLVYVESEFVAFSDAQKDESYGVGDLSLGVSYRVLKESLGWPSLTGSLTINAPTGKDEDDSDATSVAIGSDAWGVSTGLSLTKSVDPAVLFVSLGYAHTFDNDENGINIQPGDTFSYGFGAGLSINSAVSLSGRFSGSYSEEIKVNGEKRVGSSSEPVSIGLNAIYQLSNKHRLESGVNIGLNDDAGDTSFGFTYIYNLDL